MPNVSVILTSFNHGKYIREAIDSVLNQSFTDFELIIWDDASTDDSWSVISSYSDSRIKAFRNEENKRPIFGVIKAISEVATGEYIAIHHSDDVWEFDKLEKQVAFLDAHAEVGAVFTNALAIAEDSSPLADEKHFYSSIFEQPNRTRHEWLRHFFTRGNALCHPSLLIRKSCYGDCGLYRFGFAQVGDFDMWIRLCLKHEIHVLPEKLVRFRVRDNEANASGNRPEARIRVLFEFYKLLQNYRKINSFDDLVKVFPSANKYYRKMDTDMYFVLGMVSLEEKPFTVTQLFGQDLLFEAISDPKRAANIKRQYDFDYKSFIALTGQNDVFFREVVAEKDKVIAERDGQIGNLNALASRLNQTQAALGEAQQFSSERLEQIIALSSRIEATDIALGEAQQFSFERLEQLIALSSRLEATDKALGEAQQIINDLLTKITGTNNELIQSRQYIKSIEKLKIWRFLRGLGLIRERFTDDPT
jgi:glycosyltransferase involved in cell wall biosynthesis